MRESKGAVTGGPGRGRAPLNAAEVEDARGPPERGPELVETEVVATEVS